ncbi:MAG: septum formation initiator family protein [Actinobacteria bacterium]|jgi:ABC-type transport system involved in multi-copper enzyme maturation permease subunit|nr:septum formation initiator family protein [Cyanobacteriota bacterium]MCL5771237.1 septum formation initiator family protein [Actinomycetota bacterium]
MSKNSQVISSISRKSKLNITIMVFILFIIISILVSINPIVMMINKRSQIASLEDKLNTIRKENIELLAIEKSLYDDEVIKQEALKQFNISDSENKIVYKVNEIDKLKRDDDSSIIKNNEKAVYSNNNLWENLKILYYKEIYKP